MLYNIPVISFHGGHSRPVRQCTLFNPPACPSPHAERTHHLFRRGPYRHEHTLHNIAGLWKALVGVSTSEEEMHQQSQWTKRVRCEGFTSEEITVYISEEKVIVQGLRKFNDVEGTSEVRQMKKTIVIPTEICPDSVKAFFNQDGTLVLQGDRKAIEKKISIEKAAMVDEKHHTEGLHKTSEQGETTKSVISIQTAQTEDEAAKSNEAEYAFPGDNETCVMRIVDRPTHDEIKEGQTSERKKETMDEDSKNCKIEYEVGNETESQKKTETEILGTDRPNLTEESKVPEKEFKLEVDVSKFRPDSILVKSTKDSLTIVGKQNEVDQQTLKVIGSKTLLRKFFLPLSVNSDLLTSELTNGNLTISGPYI